MPMTRFCFALFFLASLSCGPSTHGTTGDNTTLPDDSNGDDDGVILDESGSLAEGDMQLGNAFSDHFELEVQEGVALTIEVTSSEFDPLLEVIPPGEGPVVNDDYEGSRERSRVDIVAQRSGALKVRVTSYNPGATGAYRIVIARPLQAGEPVPVNHQALAMAAPILVPGQTLAGTLEAGDPAQEGRLFDVLAIDVTRGRPQQLRVRGTGGVTPELIIVDPEGRAIRAEGGTARLAQAGHHRVQVLAPRAGETTVAYEVSLGAAETQAEGAAQPQLSRSHHQPPASGEATALTIGQRLRAEIAASDLTLPSGESADLYAFNAQPGHTLAIEMQSSALDSYVMVLGPNGELWENDDAEGTLNSRLEVPVPSAGQYRVVATTYRAGMTGAYELKIFEPSRQASADPRPANQAAGEPRSIQGSLAQGDPTLSSGEFMDAIEMSFRAGERVQLDLQSTEFDTYLIVRAPSGAQQDNDDVQSGNTNSALSYSVTEDGPHRVIVTSYRPGETGAYTLRVTGGGAVTPPQNPQNPQNPQPPPSNEGWQRQTGSLAQGDRTLQSGEFVDVFPMQFPAGARVRIEARSTEFDTYLIVRPPGGGQAQQNDDASPPDTNAGLDLVATAGGTYEVAVTSYRPGETGNYELLVRGAGAVATPTPTPNPNPTPTPNPNPTPAPAPRDASEVTGRLARGDSTLDGGEFVDRHTMSFPAGQPIQIRLESTNFDPYLIVRTPSGRQLDNDDLVPGNLNSGIDIPSAEAGAYTVMVTSYRAGETGRYRLVTGQNLPGPTPQVPGDQPTGGTGNFYGIFTGISDYPGGGDLPECANDAIKLAETLRTTGHMTQQNQIVLTDSQVTAAAVQQAFQQMGQRVQPNDTFIFFYSGHGNQRPNSQDPRELDGVDETLVFYDREVVDDEMARWFDQIRGLGVLTLDACFAGGFAKDVITRPGRMGLFSSEEDVLSSVAGQFQAGGYLSHFLRTGISGEADMAPRDGALTAGELSHYLFQQFGTHVRDVRLDGAWQHLVVDRGAVRNNMVLFRTR